MKHGCMVMTLRLISSCCSVEVAKFTWPKKARQVCSNVKSMFMVFSDIQDIVHMGIRTPWSTRQWQVLVWGFEAAEGGHSAQTSRHVEEQQLVSPTWQRARSHITRFSTIPDFQKHYSDSHPPPIRLTSPSCDLYLFPKMKLRLRGRRFDTTEETHAETQKVIDTLTFENFQVWRKSWETLGPLHTCPGNYFEGDGGN